MSALEFARRVRNRQHAIGYWVVLDDPIATERLARLGYDYVAVDAQHGLMGYTGIRNAMLAIDAGATSAAMVRVEQNDPFAIGRVLDAGATGVIVPLIDSAEDAAAAVRATRYPPEGRRSYGPMRAQLRVGPKPAEANESVLLLAMIETPQGLRNVAEICATPGLDGIYVGPSDLRLAVGGETSTDPAVDEVFEQAVEKIAKAAEAAGIAAGIHTPNGEVARRRLEQGYTFASVASDLVHLEQAAKAHLSAARGDL
ncbi:aldolase [Streptomyces sp. SID8361]|uniref:HpcH/HpaI aldolase family protein n=1 Tax=Streptomyces TaxID=1883 RepID=UPI00081E6799|nr:MULTISPECIES: aldolase/citrate lyase family protein [unclassified Streptomyces]AUA08740.1 5-keto-4-deoxy-D-glucarate aldolase [Streptomyces sp. M56]MYU15392.1 aldolase [Streptomyces sp. SID8361]MYX62872.1 aldolase [Streptomyces sp. SID8382]SCG09341.1 4-hydroxy-2-oxoheptanedioate aldolase [Streptomyces sp. MnatMP-M27]